MTDPLPRRLRLLYASLEEIAATTGFTFALRKEHERVSAEVMRVYRDRGLIR